MKKSLLTLGAILATLGITAFSYLNLSQTEIAQQVTCQHNPDLVYKIASRFHATVTKQDLDKASSVLDIIPIDAYSWWQVSFQSITVALLKDGEEITANGDDKELNVFQIKLLNSSNYSDNFYIKGRGKDNDPVTGRIEDYAYYFTIVPEKEAEYANGYNSLITYLREKSKDQTSVITEDNLRAAQIRFTVTKEGKVANPILDSTSGYPAVDALLLELISNLPGKWNPAENAEGEKVAQELVFFFGIEGC